MSRSARVAPLLATVLAVAACSGGGDGGPDDGNAFNPTANTSISGNVTFSSVNIPAGVTVTVTSDAVITVEGDYTQAGTLLAPCHALTLLVDGAVTVTGTIRNQCATATATPPDLRIVGKTSYSFSNGTIATSGDLSIVNDPSEGLNPAAAAAGPRLVVVDGPKASQTIGRCNFDNETIDIDDGPAGTAANPNGADGPSAFLGCGFLFSGNTGGKVTMNNVTINGASGGNGLPDTKTDATATGGNGGPPGSIFVSADEDIELTGGITINGGDGGRGGDATSTGSDGNPGKDATATAGHGGGLDPGSDPVRFEAGGAISQVGTLTVNIGKAGNGGDATATGGNGVAANPGAPGGKSTATGGNGGNGMSVRMNASGAVTLSGAVIITGGAAGDGGQFSCPGGNGGDGLAPGSPGGPGGAKNCRGGNGGQGGPATLRVDDDPLAKLTPGTAGGDAGSGEFTGGKGGNGAPNCPTGPGGAGGKGSDITGGDGSRGLGNPNGSGGNASVMNAANGGNGAAPGGARGEAGVNGLSHGAGTTGPFNIANSFNPGQPGGTCPPSPVPAEVKLNLASSTPALTPGVVQPGSYVVQLLDAATQAAVGTMRIIAKGAAGNTFYGNNAQSGGPRVGWTNVGSWEFDLTSAVANGQPYRFSRFKVCIINGSASQAAPVEIREFDQVSAVGGLSSLIGPRGQNRVLLNTTFVTTAPFCANILLNGMTRAVELAKSGLGSSIDANEIGGVDQVASPGTQIRFCNRDSDRTILWAGYSLNGGATWTQGPVVSDANGQHYDFTASGNQVGAATVKDLGNNNILTNYYIGTLEETQKIGDNSCQTPGNGPNTVAGTFSGLQSGEASFATYGLRTTTVLANGPFSWTNVPTGTANVLASAINVTTGTSRALFLERNVGAPLSTSPFPINLTTGAIPVTATLALSNLVSGDEVFLIPFLFMPQNPSNPSVGFVHFRDFTATGSTATQSIQGVPPALVQSGDFHGLFAEVGRGAGTLSYYGYSTTFGDRTVAFWSPLSTVAATCASSGGAPVRVRIQSTVPSQYGDYFVAQRNQALPGGGNRSSIGYATYTYTAGVNVNLTTPDFVPAGYNPVWGLQPNVGITGSLSAYGSNTPGGSLLGLPVDGLKIYSADRSFQALTCP